MCVCVRHPRSLKWCHSIEDIFLFFVSPETLYMPFQRWLVEKICGWNALHIASCGKNLVYKCAVNTSRSSAKQVRDPRLVYRADRLVCYAHTPLVRFVVDLSKCCVHNKLVYKSTTSSQQIECLQQLHDKLYNKSATIRQSATSLQQ